MKRRFSPTQHPPGSPGKVSAMERRYRCGLPLHHPHDAGWVAIDLGREIMPEQPAQWATDEDDDELDEAGSILDVDETAV